MIDVQSVVIYIGLAACVFSLGKLAEVRNQKWAVWGIALLLSLVAGLRAVNVGIDTKTYTLVFNLTAEGSTDAIYGIEQSFIYICAFLLRLWSNVHFVFFVLALLSHGLILFRIWEDRENISLRWAILAYYVMFYAFSLNGVRQFVAVAIVVYATRFVRQGKYFKFVLGILAATLFHTTALVGLAYLPFEVLSLRYFNKERRTKSILLCAAVMVALLVLAPGFLAQYVSYFERQETAVGFMLLAKILLLLASILIIRQATGQRKGGYAAFTYRWYYFIGMALTSLSYFFLYMGRIGMYYYIFEAFFIGYIFKVKNYSVGIILLKAAYVFLLAYYLWISISHGGQGEIPYRFFWQI